MKVQRSNYFAWFIVSLMCVAALASVAKPSASISSLLSKSKIFRQDTSKKDTNEKYKPSKRPKVNPQDRYGNPLTEQSSSPLLLPNPSNIQTEVEMDSNNNFYIREKVGERNYRAPSTMTLDEYSKIQQQRYLRNYWKSKSEGLDGESAVTGRSLIPKIYISPAFDRIFGGNYVDIKPNGFVSLDFGIRSQRVNNPAYPIRQQRQPPNFDFDQQINMNVTGDIGEKAKITANFDTKSSFQFENNIKFDYTGFEEDIIKKIEIGNVNLPLNNSLMQGAQNLFGIKTQLQFGKLFVTSVASTQRGTRENVKINGGSQKRNFQIKADGYEDNRHFFLSHFFRDNYETALNSLPNPTGGVNIPQDRVEVYVINRSNNTDALRSIVGLADLGESKNEHLSNKKVVTINGRQGSPSDNKVNSLYTKVINSNIGEGADSVSRELINLGLQRGTDFEKITGARRLTERDFTVHPQLGYISLNTALKPDEILAVAFQYTYQGKTFKVGELTEDYQNKDEKEAVFLKLIRPNSIMTNSPMWDLQMKNIYPLGASGINRENFQLRLIYRDDKTGLDNPTLQEGVNTRNIPLLQLFEMDQLNANLDPQPDGNFDYIENITIDPRYGRIIFPVLEPFGSDLREKFDDSEVELINKYVFQELYEKTKQDAALTAGKNKFFIVGNYEASGAEGVNLNAIGITPGSVRVTQGGKLLEEHVDYEVDYNTGQVTFLKEQYNQPGADIDITYEKDEFFTPTTKTLIGTRLDYRVNKDFNIGGTMLYLNERPLISRISVGDEPTRNVIYGADISYSKDSRVLTRLVDRLPFIRTKEISNISATGEFAQLIPGTSNKNSGEGIAYIDDFEGSETPYDLGRQPNTWKLSATPAEDKFVPNTAEPLKEGFRRAKLAWYSIDQTVFFRNTGQNKPDNITKDDTESNHYSRAIGYNEVFQNLQETTLPTPQSTFDLAYFPAERGPYNFNPNLTPEGNLPNPAQNWAGITRAITNDTDFENLNVEYIEFWLMDPFIEGPQGRVIVNGTDGTNNTDQTGKLIFNLGNISEDVIPDGKHMFENGLPSDGNVSGIPSSEWGYTPEKAYLNNAFEVGSGARDNQDVGLDGLNNQQEAEFYADEYLNKIAQVVSAETLERIKSDPAADDFEYFLGAEKDAADAKIVGRYKDYNGVERNSPDVTNTNTSFVPVGSTIPDNEDLNRDNTLNELDSYYKYEIDLNPSTLNINNNKYIVDQITSETGANWFLFRIPIREPSAEIGNPQGFKTIRFVRTLLTGFTQPVVLRFLNFQMVASQWRKFVNPQDYEKLMDPGTETSEDPKNPSFVVSTVNIEENGPPLNGEMPNRTPYMLPPGFSRDRDNSSLRERKLNEQSLRLCLDGLADGDARAVFKNVNFDFINYKRLKMNIHAESEDEMNVEDKDVTAFIRLGTDFFENYYEIEVPLYLTRGVTLNENEIWPNENLIDIAFKSLTDIKVKRNQVEHPRNLPYSDMVDDKYRVTVVGNPDYSSVQIVMLGIRNPRTPGDESPKSVCIWANELRVTDFDNTAGWAATGKINAKLADFATVTASGRMSTYGFGGLQDRISERAREDTKQYFLSSNVNLDKFFPQHWGLKIPMFVSYENEVKTPKFDPLDRDVPLETSVTKFTEKEDQEDYLALVEDRSVRRSINFTNVGKVKTNENAKTHLWDIENLSATYAYSDEKRSSENMESYLAKTYKIGLGYNYSNNPKYFEPFKNGKLFDSPFLKAIKDFNIGLGPSTITVRGDLDRRFIKSLYRDLDLNNLDAPNFNIPNYQKAFTFTRNYDMRWNLTKNLAFDYTAIAYAIIDEPAGEINTQENRDSVMVNLMKLGRMKDFSQTGTVTYKLPLNKFPLTDWVDAQAKYAVGYNWRAGAISPQPGVIPGQADTLGNFISNSREYGVVGKVNLTTLYNKVKFLKEINKPAPPQRSRPAPAQPGAKPDSVQQKPQREMKFLKEFFKLLMTVKSLDFNYTVSEQTNLPGFLPKANALGMDQSWDAPGWDFVTGSQNPGITNRIAENGWLAPSGFQTNPFEQIKATKISVRTQLEPIKDLKIQLDAKKDFSENYTAIFRYALDEFSTVTDEGDTVYHSRSMSPYYGYSKEQSRYGIFNPSRSGNYSISIISIKTSFDRNDSENKSGAFKNFEKFRGIIETRLEAQNPNYNEQRAHYDINSQDVLIPAFIAAYTGESAESVKLNSFPKIPLPNWRVDYAGLGKMGGLKDIFSSFIINHAYTSTFTVGNFVSAYDYQNVPYLNSEFDYPFAYIADSSGRFVPFFVMNDVTIEEQFSPLLGINFRTKKRMTGRVEYKTSRMVGLNLSNTQINEQTRKEFVFSFGYTTNNFKIPFKIEGKTVVLKNDLNFRCDVSVSDNTTIQRAIDEENTITQGMLAVQIRPNVSYLLNQRLQLQIYFERGINTPKVSNSYKRSTTAFGAQLRFSLAD